MNITLADSETCWEAVDMARYFIELAYKGTHYSGFQVQENANTIQAEIAKAFHTIHRCEVALTGSSRTDAGVHALQNFFHFDFNDPVHPQFVYKANALLPPDIVVKKLIPVKDDAHCRFDATGRDYEYRITSFKDPFTRETALYFPYQPDLALMQKAAAHIKAQTNFFAFAKTNSQVKHFNCSIRHSEWERNGDMLIYKIGGNRFLRGMVRQLTATLLKLGRGRISFDEFAFLFEQEKQKCSFSVPARGLFLCGVNFPENYFP
jgi:tRNA pseudouridine38-40 synthase